MIELLIWTVVLLLHHPGTVNSECTVENCNSSHCYPEECTSCNDGYYLHSPEKCNPCISQYCATCDNDVSCKTCKPSRYGYYCGSQCHNCRDRLCHKSNGTCVNGCIDGYYYSSLYKYCRACKQNCKACSSYHSCSACVQGYYLQSNACKICNNRCVNCTGEYVCTACERSSYWGNYCQNQCVGCTDCSKETGCSKGCNDRYYQHFNNNKTGYECISCPVDCLRCKSLDDCQECISGTWGESCENSCSGCYNNVCDKDSGCTHGCKSGFFMTFIQNKIFCNVCPDNCKTCSSLSECHVCKPGYNGTHCQFNCNNCNAQLCDKDSGACTHECGTNQYFNYMSIKCQQCPHNCLKCSSLSYCYLCMSGKWGKTCQTDCGHNCKNGSCEKNSGDCSKGCIEGYWGQKCLHKCLSGCRSCQTNSSCVDCRQGNYHRDSKLQCECSDDITKCMETGWYPKASGCCPCSSNCIENVCFANGTCSNCSGNRYGDTCEIPCSTSCKDKLCYRNGNCISCANQRKYGPKCSLDCYKDKPNCIECHGLDKPSLICTRCNSGTYVDRNNCISCSDHCKHGKYNCDTVSGTCKYGCKVGWFGQRCISQCNVTNCISCPNNPNECHACHLGFYSANISSCQQCPDNCHDKSACNLYNGSCTDGCTDGWSGAKCNKQCAANCKACNQLNSTSCDICRNGFYGESCEEPCNPQCKNIPELQVCRKRDGSCEFGCNTGFWGDDCKLPCEAGCSGGICNRTTAVCQSGCKFSHYGSVCKNTCSDHCLSNNGSANARICHSESGACLFDCRKGWFGEKCDVTCSENCKSNACFKNNGTCTLGCTAGYTGSTCMQALISDETDISALVIGGGAGGGVAVLIILLIVIVVLIVRRRRNSSKLDTHDSGGTHSQQKVATTDTGPLYSNINDSGIINANEGLKGVTNQLYANTVVRMSDISGKEEQVGRTISARPGSEDYLTEEDMVDGERIDVEQSETSGVSDNTYYNLGGKRVQVEKLADYVKHTCTKDINQEFHEIPKGLLKGHKEAKKAKNAAKNKYRLIYPYDETRVILCDGGNDYMNASYVDGHTRQKEYIASSGPFKKSYDTTNDFWRMILQEKCETLVMLTNPTENKEVKCEKYWPDVGQSCNYGNIHVTCVTEDIYADFTIRTLAATKKEDKLNVCHLHFTAWPDKGVPHDVTSMIEFRQKVRSLHKDKTCPIIVHCSAGIGRTGTFIALDLMTNEGEARGSIDIFGSVFNLRYQRCNMVQTPDQYVYLHHALLHSLTFDCHSIPGDTFLQNYNKLLEKNGGQRIIDNQYQQLQSVAEELTDDDRTEIDRNKAFVKKNRIGADVPVDENRVKLKENRKPEDSDYINAVYINSFRKHQKFIVAQTPLPTTVVDFLTLIYQEKCSCVVSMEEANMKDKTVKVYWPADNQIVKHGVFQVSCKESKTEKNYMIKKLSLTYHGPKGMETHDVNLFIFTNWREGAPVPSSSDSLLDLVKTVDVMNYKTETNSPILIHCRTGAERSCLYCAVSILIEKMEIEHEDQYKFCHQAVITYLQSFDTYSNFS